MPRVCAVGLVFERRGNSDRSKPAEKSVARAGDDDCLDGLVAREVVERVADLVAQRDRQRVLLRRPIERQHGVRVVAFDPEVGFHLCVPNRGRRVVSRRRGRVRGTGSRSTTTRVTRPAATSPRPSLTETRNVSRRPSIDSSVASADTRPPTGVGRQVGELHLITDRGRVGRQVVGDRFDGGLLGERDDARGAEHGHVAAAQRQRRCRRRRP